MKRIAHIIKKIKSCKIPSNLLFFDSETTPIIDPMKPTKEEHKLNFGIAHAFRYEKSIKSRFQKCEYFSPKAFWDFLLKRIDISRPLWVFAHNLGFDLTCVDFWKTVDRMKFHIENYVIDDPPTFFICRIHHAKVIFVDTLNYWRTSLSKLATSLNMEKYDLPSHNAAHNEWSRYCDNDVRILEMAVCRFIDYVRKNNLGGWGLSTPSIAYKAFCKRFMRYDIYLHDDLKTCRLERDSYYGGRVDCYYVGKAPKQTYYKLDVNSLYPYVMLNEFPTKLIERGKDIRPNELLSRITKYACVARCKIKSKQETFPLRYNGRLCEVLGTYETTLCGPELERALRTKSIIEISKYSVYQKRKIFVDYVKFFWNERLKFKKIGDDVSQNLAKIFLNSLYGKFGQSGWSYQELNPRILFEFYKNLGINWSKNYSNKKRIPKVIEHQIKWFPFKFKKPVILRRIGDRTEIRFPEEEHYGSFPLIAAYVTSYAREYHRELIQICGKQNVYYVDTDSLIVNQKGYNNAKQRHLLHSTELGKLKTELTTNHLIIYGPKDYEFGSELVSKGIRKHAIRIKGSTYSQLQFEGIKSILKCNGKSSITVKRIVKHNKRSYLKGLMFATGWTKPFVLSFHSHSQLND